MLSHLRRPATSCNEEGRGVWSLPPWTDSNPRRARYRGHITVGAPSPRDALRQSQADPCRDHRSAPKGRRSEGPRASGHPGIRVFFRRRRLCGARSTPSRHGWTIAKRSRATGTLTSCSAPEIDSSAGRSTLRWGSQMFEHAYFVRELRAAMMAIHPYRRVRDLQHQP